MNRRTARRLARVAGWLLTPLVVWAASFLGGWAAAVLWGEAVGGTVGLLWLAGGAVVGGLIGAAAWLAVMWHARGPGDL